jgi:hypothetical protein
VPELEVGKEVLSTPADFAAFGDNAFVSAPVAERLWGHHCIRPWTLPRRNEQRTVTTGVLFAT